jgi:multidrug efflux system outer membrane protein
MTRLAIPTALAAIMMGCRTMAPPVGDGLVEGGVPGAWKSSAEAVGGVDDGWISSFEDSALQSLVDEAERKNHDLKIAAARVDKARANARNAGAKLYPTVSGGLNGARRKQAFIGFPFGSDDSQAPGSGSSGTTASGAPSMPGDSNTGEGVLSSFSSTFGVSLDVSWEVDVWGRIRAGLAAALAEVQGSEAELVSLRSSIAAQTAKAWFAAQEAELQLRLAKDSLTSFEDSVEIIRSKYVTADQSASQLRVAKSDVATAAARVKESEELKGQAIRQLETLLGRYPAAEIAVGGDLPKMPRPVPAGLPSELLTRRPDLQAAERRIAASDKRILEAKLATLPQFALTASGGTTTQTLKDVLNSDFGIWSLAGNMIQPLLEPQLRGNRDLRIAETKEAISDYNKVVLNAFREVENALAAERFLKARENSLLEAESLSSEAYEQARDEYRQGLSDVITLLTTQRQMLSAKTQVVSMRRLRLENRVDVHLALGGDFKIRKAGVGARN